MVRVEVVREETCNRRLDGKERIGQKKVIKAKVERQRVNQSKK